MNKNYCIVDLHLHLDGSLSPKIIIEIAKEENIDLPTYNEKELLNYLQVPATCTSLNEYLTKFDLPNLVLQSKNGLYKATLDLLKREAIDGLKYIEIRMAPQLSTQKGLKQKEVVETLIKAINDGHKIYGIKSNLILCLMRFNNNQKENIETINVAKEFLNKGVVAIDLAGAEALFPNEMFYEQFEYAKELNIPFTIHAGEASDASSVVTALSMGAKRIGHGIHSIDDPKVINYLKEHNIPLEICPKSNLDTKAITKFEELPVKELLKHGVKVTINTDDMTVSNTNLENEFNILKNIGLNDDELKQIALNSIDASFLNDDEKDQLRKFIN